MRNSYSKPRGLRSRVSAYLRRPALSDHGPPTRTADMKNNGLNNAINAELSMPEAPEIVVLVPMGGHTLSVKYHCENSDMMQLMWYDQAQAAMRAEF